MEYGGELAARKAVAPSGAPAGNTRSMNHASEGVGSHEGGNNFTKGPSLDMPNASFKFHT